MTINRIEREVVGSDKLRTIMDSIDFDVGEPFQVLAKKSTAVQCKKWIGFADFTFAEMSIMANAYYEGYLNCINDLCDLHGRFGVNKDAYKQKVEIKNSELEKAEQTPCV